MERSHVFLPPYVDELAMVNSGIASVGRGVKVASNAIIAGIHNLNLGSHVRIDSNVVLAIGDGGLDIGSFTHIGGCSHINATEGVVIGDFVSISQGVRIYSASDDYSGQWLANPTVPVEYRRSIVGAVRIEALAIIGSGSVVLPGVEIGEGAAIGALSLVKRNVPPWTVWGGSPARQIGERSRRALELSEEVIKRSGES